VSVRPSNTVTREEEVFLATLAAARGLYGRLAKDLDCKHLEAEFDRLGALIESLPLTVDRGLIGFLRNWTASSRQLWEQGEAGAARYQLRQMGNLVPKQALYIS
jgi:hypothetical protein